jgi:hypothetical protein
VRFGLMLAGSCSGWNREQPQHAIDLCEVRAVLLQLAFKLFYQPSDERPFLSRCGDDMWIGHPDMVGWRLAALNMLVVALAR